MIKHQKSFELANSSRITFSVCDNRLLFIHGDFISAQYVMDLIGIDLVLTSHNVHFKVYSAVKKTAENYLSFYFQRNEFDHLTHYFKSLGYPLPQIQSINTLSNEKRNSSVH